MPTVRILGRIPLQDSRLSFPYLEHFVPAPRGSTCNEQCSFSHVRPVVGYLRRGSVRKKHETIVFEYPFAVVRTHPILSVFVTFCPYVLLNSSNTLKVTFQF